MGTTSESVHSIGRRTGRLDMVGTVMVCQKCFIDTNKILELANQIIEYDTYAASASQANKIIKCIQDPLADLPKHSVETTISRRVIQMMNLDVLGNDAVLITGTGGYDNNHWYRIDVPRGFALRMLTELEDTWLHGPNAEIRRTFHRAHKTLKRALGV